VSIDTRFLFYERRGIMRALLIVCSILVFAVPVLGQSAGTIYLTGDSEGTDCGIIDRAQGVVKVHMLAYVPRGLAVEFAAPKPACWTGATYLGESIAIEHPLHLGDTQQSEYGLTVYIGPPGPLCPEGGSNSLEYIGYISYSISGKGPACCEYPVIKAPNDTYEELPGPIASVCTDEPVRPEDQHIKIVPVIGQSVYINPDVSCPCAGNAPAPAERSTWGEIKALYQ
jgi:hypothetical protein